MALTKEQEAVLVQIVEDADILMRLLRVENAKLAQTEIQERFNTALIEAEKTASRSKADIVESFRAELDAAQKAINDLERGA